MMSQRLTQQILWFIRKEFVDTMFSLTEIYLLISQT